MYPRSKHADANVPFSPIPTVLIVGMGALGCPAAAAIARSGEIRLILIDEDVVEATNLQRQKLFSIADIGRPKAEAAANALQTRFPDVKLAFAVERLNAANAVEWFERADFAIDACDDPNTKFLINEVAVRTRTPFAYGGVMRTGGSTMTVVPGESPCLACVFPQAAESSDGLGCDRAGILAPVAGVIGAWQALAAVSWLTGGSRSQPGVFTAYELRARRWRALRFERVKDCRVCGEPQRPTPSPRRVESCLS